MSDLLTFGGQLLVLLGAILGAGGGVRYLAEPVLKRRHLRKVMATGVWLSCYELRCHLEEIYRTLYQSDDAARTREALRKLPRYDYGKRADWFVKQGYFVMITAYRIAAFSSWTRIYQTATLQALLTTKRSSFVSELFDKFDAFKVAASQNTVLWYNYIDAIGEKLMSSAGDTVYCINFSDFCKKYYSDEEFLFYFDQLHMFIHFMGSEEIDQQNKYKVVLEYMITALNNIENFLSTEKENLLRTFRPRNRRRTAAVDYPQHTN